MCGENQQQYLHLNNSMHFKKPRRLLNWGVTRYAFIGIGLCQGFAAAYLFGEEFSSIYLETIGMAIGGLIVFYFVFPKMIAWQKTSLLKNSIWKIPEWNSPPSPQTYPMSFFHFIGCYVSAAAVGMVLSGIVIDSSILPFALGLLCQMVAFWMGFRKAILLTTND